MTADNTRRAPTRLAKH